MNTLIHRLISTIRDFFLVRIEFNDGSYIEYFNREAILYVENNGRKMEIVWYFQKGRMKGRILYTSDINYWDAPYEKEIIPIQKKVEIKEKIIEYCRRKKIPLSIKSSEGPNRPDR